ncbi:MAG TPA: polysaccharide deacetylase family protein [Promicromonospora sp.]|nr:polysaccharide deacetylase family protein [Promicromonospora sp.]
MTRPPTPARRLLAVLALLLTLPVVAAGCAATGTAPTDPGAAERKVLYLTFDDGPGDETVEILDLLRAHDGKAVFFALGQNLARHTDLGRRVVAEGHALANHTWDHANLTRLDTDGRAHQLEPTADLLRSLGSESPCVRPPYGATDDTVAADLAVRGAEQVLWTVDPADWSRPGADVIAERLLTAPRGAVVLLHDGGGDRTQTVDALRQALPRLAADGWTFETVPGC